MKKWMIFALFALILLSSFVIAANGTTGTDTGAANISNLGGVASSAGQEVQSKLTQDVAIPSSLQFLSRILFGVKEGEKIALNELIIMLAFTLVIFLVVYNLVAILPFFSGSAWKLWASSIIITLLVGVSGGIKDVSLFFAGLGAGIAILGKYPILRLIVSLAILGVILLTTTKVSNLIKAKMEIEKARETGAAVKRGAESGKVLSEGVSELADRKKSE
jgi:hypothetical protein